MDDVFILNQNSTDAARSGLLRLHEAVLKREPNRPEVKLSPDELLARFRAADPTRNGSCLSWLLKTYTSGGYRLEDLSKAYDTLVTFARLRGQLPNTATIDGETRNPRKLGSHVTLASLWTVIAPFVEAERLAEENKAGAQVDVDKERALAQSRVLVRSDRMVIVVPMTKEASCWWGKGTQWCTAANKNNAFEEHHKNAPLIVVCLRKVGDLPARKLQLYVHANDMQFMDENDANVSLKLIQERWQDLEYLIYWAVSRDELALQYVPEPLRTEAMCTEVVGRNGWVLDCVPEHLRTEAICTTAVTQNALALEYVPKHLRTKAMCTAAVGSDGRALHYVPEPLRTEAMCTTAVERHGEALQFVPEHLRTEAMSWSAVVSNGMALPYVPELFRTEAMSRSAVGKNGWALQFIPKPLRTEEICLVAVGRDGRALRYIPELLCTEVMCLAAVAGNGDSWTLQYVPRRLRTEAICLAAVGRNGLALEYVPEHLRTESICTVAVEQDGLALEYVPELLRTEALCLAAVEQDTQMLDYVPKPLRMKIRLATEKQSPALLSAETNEHSPHDLELEGLENYLKNLQPGYQDTYITLKSGVS